VVYTLGEHRLLCGDSTAAEDLSLVLDGESRIDLCMTDPPYGADIQYEGHVDTQEALAELIEKFLPLCMGIADVVALTPGINNVFSYPRPAWLLCWFYGAGTGSTPWGFTAWQPFMVWGSCPKLAHGEGRHPDGFQYMMSRDDAEENRALGHVCPKPMSVWLRFMERLSHDGSKTVYDPFVGSGTTIIAAEKLGRRCYAIEIEPAYVDVCRKRWAEFVHGEGCDWEELTRGG